MKNRRLVWYSYLLRLYTWLTKLCVKKLAVALSELTTQKLLTLKWKMNSKRRTNIYSNSITVRLDNKQRRNWLKDTLMLKVYTMELIKMKSCFSKMRNFSRGLQKLHHLRASWGLELFQMFLSMEELTIKLRLLINRLSISQIIRLLINLKWQEIRVDPLLAIQMPNSPMWDLMVNRRRQHVS